MQITEIVAYSLIWLYEFFGIVIVIIMLLLLLPNTHYRFLHHLCFLVLHRCSNSFNIIQCDAFQELIVLLNNTNAWSFGSS